MAIDTAHESQAGTIVGITAKGDLATAIVEAMPVASWPFWFEGWPDDLEAALLDAVFSSRATYGSETTGVRRVVAAWRSYRGAGNIGDVSTFGHLRRSDMLDILDNLQRVSGNKITKAEAVQQCSTVLVSHGVRSAGDLAALDSESFGRVRDAVLDVPGVGPATWEVMVGSSGVDQDLIARGVRAFVSTVLGREVTPSECAQEIADAAVELAVEEPVLRHSIWRYQRRYGTAR